MRLALTLLMLGACTADDANYATAVNDLALVTDLLYRCANFHLIPFEYDRRKATCFEKAGLGAVITGLRETARQNDLP
jgi:hypothetical protein